MPNSIPSKIKTTLKLRTCETQNFSLQDKKMHACHKQQEHPGFTSGSRTSSAWLRGGLDGGIKLDVVGRGSRSRRGERRQEARALAL